jgi:hypothetical protein
VPPKVYIESQKPTLCAAINTDYNWQTKESTTKATPPRRERRSHAAAARSEDRI